MDDITDSNYDVNKDIATDVNCIWNLKRITRKLENVLHSVKFCGLCFEIEKLLIILDSEVFVNRNIGIKPFKEILYEVFCNDKDIPASLYICNHCIEKVIQSYVFIHNTKECVNVIKDYLNNFYTKAVDLNLQLDPNFNYGDSKFVIVLENNIETDVICDDPNIDVNIQKTEIEDIQIESSIDTDKIHGDTIIEMDGASTKRKAKDSTVRKENHVGVKLHKTTYAKTKNNAFKCLECKAVLITFKQWKKHEQTYHKKTIPSCTDCKKTFKNIKLLKKHYMTHNKIVCSFCNIPLSTTEYAAHLKTDHENEQYSCQYCGIVNNSWSSSQRHLIEKHLTEHYGEIDGKFHCKLCTKYFEKEKLRSHPCKFRCSDCVETPCVHYKYLEFYRDQCLRDAIAIKCLDCEYVCLKKDSLIGHVNREHLDYHPFKCDICGTEFYSKLNLKTHIFKYHVETIVCEFCDKKFKVKSFLDKHLDTCRLEKRDFQCMQCNASFEDLDKLTKHVDITHNRNISCNMCTKKFKTENELEIHRTKTHRNTQLITILQQRECTICDKRFGLRNDYNEHIKAHETNGISVFPCKQCNIELESRKKLVDHNRMKHNPRVRCRICSKRMWNSDLNTHMQEHKLRNDHIRFTCETCGKSFAFHSLLKIHKKKHTEPVPCKICTKLVKLNALNGHMKLHNETIKAKKKIKRNYQCSYCNEFFTKTALDGHINKYHLKIKPYVCEICNVAYSSKYQLNEHKLIHNEEKWFTCQFCEKKMRRKIGLKKHLMTHTGERPHICEICGQGFKTINLVNLHKLRHGDKTVACPLCNGMFYTVKEVRWHIRSSHWKYKDKPFNHKELEGLTIEHYYIFQDGRYAVDDSD